MADQPASLTAIGDQQLTVSTVTRLTLPVSSTGRTLTPRHALIYVGTDAIRWLGGQVAGGGAVVGTTPSASLGILVPAGGYIDWTDPTGDFFGLIKWAQFIKVTNNAVLDVIYFT